MEQSHEWALNIIVRNLTNLKDSHVYLRNADYYIIIERHYIYKVYNNSIMVMRIEWPLHWIKENVEHIVSKINTETNPKLAKMRWKILRCAVRLLDLHAKAVPRVNHPKRLKRIGFFDLKNDIIVDNTAKP